MSAQKIEAIYELREAAEEHGRIDAATAQRHDAAARTQRLAAREKLEEKTVKAIEVCHECGRPHADDEPHDEPHTERSNVIEGDFGRQAPDSE